MHSPSTSPQILQLLSRKVDRDVIDYLVRTTIETVDSALERPTSHLFATPSSIPRPFLQLALDVIRRSRVDIPVILVALVYVERARPQFKISDERWACERILIGALVLAAKYVSDYTIKNARWARWTGTFSKEDIGRMERELLDILDWNLSVAEGDVMAHHEHLSPTPAPCPPPTSLKRPRCLFQADPGLCLELSPFCPLPPSNQATTVTVKSNRPTTVTVEARSLTCSVTLPGFSSFLHNPYRHPLASSPSSLQSGKAVAPAVTSEGERVCKRPRLVANTFSPRQPLSLTNKHRRRVAAPLQQAPGGQIFNPLALSRPWLDPFDPFILPYIPPVSFYES